MSLSSGSRIGPYEIEAPIGAGGMGEVYRARDTKLDRQVAIKILPDEFASDADRLMRFEREAKTLASLNHPHIAQIYGLEDRALVMELVEGPTLTELIAAGGSDSVNGRGRGLPIAEALAIARQIAEALEAAHGQGIIHRDLKPGNVKVRPDGTVKVLDFGLAKALDPASSLSGSPPRSMANSPTMSVQGTRAGIILGTAAYMSPEQAAGRVVDKRSDIWAFGVVLFEMLSGRPLFDGESAAHILAEVLKTEPSWDTLPPQTPAAIRKLLRRCLEKKPSARIHDMGDVRLEIEDAIKDPGASTVGQSAPVRAGIPAWVYAAGLAFAIIAAALGRWTAPQPDASKAIVRLSLLTMELEASFPAAVLSPDGTRLALIPAAGHTPVWIRPLDQLEAKAIPGTEGANFPFFSPDGQWLGYRDGNNLKKVRIDAKDAPLTITAGGRLGAAWGPDNTIVFNKEYQSGLFRVPAAGGAPVKLTDPDTARHELGHFWPQFLPGGKSVLFTSYSTPIERSTIEIVSLENGTRTKLVEGGYFGRYLPTGHILYLRAETVVAVPFDVASLRITGAPVPVADDVLRAMSNGVAQISVADNGTMAYIPAAIGNPPSMLVSVDRTGTPRPITPAKRHYSGPRLSPDGAHVAMTIEEPSADVWVLDLARDIFTRITSAAAGEFSPLWTHDGKRLVYTQEEPAFSVFSRPWASTGGETAVVAGPYDTIAYSVTNDDRFVLYDESNPDTRGDVMVAPLDRSSKPTPVLHSNFDERRPVLSPDGRWLAYTSNESSQGEVYVQAYPGGGDRLRVSTDGGDRPVWSHDGRELFYVSGSDRMMAVTIKAGADLQVGTPVVLFNVNAPHKYQGGFDVAKDGRFVMAERDPDAPPFQVHVVLNWFEELRAKMK